MTKQDAIKWLRFDIEMMKFDPTTGEEAYLDGDAENVIKAQEMAIEALSAQPEIIRCKECKYSEHWYSDKARCFLWHKVGIDVFEDGFCNYAGRRDDE